MGNVAACPQLAAWSTAGRLAWFSSRGWQGKSCRGEAKGDVQAEVQVDDERDVSGGGFVAAAASEISSS